jgi:molybdopterin/thiamine biosynthesis adenylyltransferase
MKATKASDLSDSEANRYARQVVLSDIGWEGQQKLKGSTVLMIGAGGLGSPMLIQLASMGIGRIRIIDRDVVSRTDLHRQYLYREADAGRPKVEVAIRRLREINPAISVEGFGETVTLEGLLRHMKGVDVVLDGLDGMMARYAVNRAAFKMKIPYVFSSAVEMFGDVSTIVPDRTPCLECFFGGLTDDSTPKCAVVGVHPAVLGVVASIAVSEAVKLLTGAEPSLASRLFFVDLRHFSFDTINLARNPKCPVSGKGKAVTGPVPKLVERACSRDGSGTYFINPAKALDLPLRKLDPYSVRKGFTMLAEGELFRTMRLNDLYDVSIMKSGTAMFKVKKPVMDIDSAEDRMVGVFKEIVRDGLQVSWDSYRPSGRKGKR